MIKLKSLVRKRKSFRPFNVLYYVFKYSTFHSNVGIDNNEMHKHANVFV